MSKLSDNGEFDGKFGIKLDIKFGVTCGGIGGGGEKKPSFSGILFNTSESDISPFNRSLAKASSCKFTSKSYSLINSLFCKSLFCKSLISASSNGSLSEKSGETKLFLASLTGGGVIPEVRFLGEGVGTGIARLGVNVVERLSLLVSVREISGKPSSSKASRSKSSSIMLSKSSKPATFLRFSESCGEGCSIPPKSNSS